MQRRTAFKRDLLRLLDAINAGQPANDISTLGLNLIKTAEGFDVKGIEALQLDPVELVASLESKMAELEALGYPLSIIICI